MVRALDPTSTASGSAGEVRRALIRGQMELHYQPQVTLATGAPDGVEALLRWRHPTGGLLAPGTFMDAMDPWDHDAVARFVVETAVEQAEGWSKAGIDTAVSVNVEPISLRPALVDLVAGCLRGCGLAPGGLRLEITEGSLSPDREAGRCLRALRELGVGLSLDDFGTGFSSLSRLHELDVDELKVDRRFLMAATRHPRARTIISCVTEMGRQLGVRIVAEGIEATEHVRLARRLGFCTGQGYLFGRPMEPEAVGRWLADR